MKHKITDDQSHRSTDLKRLALAVAFGMGLGTGGVHAQATLEVGGAATIGTDVLSDNKVPAGGVNWTVNGNTGGIKYSGLVSPAVAVGTTGNVTLTFDHRYNFEETGDPWDGGAVFVSVNAGPFTYVPLASFSSNGYVGPTTANVGSAWEAGGEDVFYGQSAGYGTPALITSVADLGTLTAGDTVAVEFRGGWDSAVVNGPPAWEIATVKLTDAGAADILDADFTADGSSNFTVSNIGTVTGPWTYLTPINRFEINADTLTADRYAPNSAPSVINLNGAKIQVVLLAGTLDPADSFVLFDLSGGSSLTGTVSSITLPVGVWDTSALATTGTITYVSAPTETVYTGPNGAYNSDTWNTAGNWDVGVPSGTIDAVIGTGKHAGVALSTTPVYTGDLTLEANSQLTIGEGSTITGLNALGTGSITFNTGSRITLRWSTASSHSQNFVMSGDATFAIGSSTAAHNDDRTLTGVISGAGQMIVRSTNGQRLTIQNTNPSWSGGLIMGGALSENKNEGLRANAAGAFGTGNVTVDDGVGLLISVADAIGDAATLSLSGGDGEETSKLNMAASDTVNRLVVDGYPQPAGTYGALASAATYKRAWITGASLLTVASAPADTTAPTVTFAGTAAGGSTTDIYIGEPVTYTVTFSEPHTPALTASDLENSTATAVTIGSVTPLPLTGGMTTVSYRVVVTPTQTGTLNLQIKSGAAIADLFGNALVVPVADNDTYNVNALPPIQGQLGVWKPWANGGINPATGNPWQVGDTYRLAFVTGTTRDATSTVIADYNTFVQTAAASSIAYPNLGNGTWKVIGSTATVAAKDNTNTNPTTDGTGVAVILMDGSTLFATNNTDLWDGSPSRPDVAGVFMSPYLDQEGVEPAQASIFTGTQVSGIPEASRILGGSTEVPPKVTTGQIRPNTNGRWLVQFNAAATSSLRFFALSAPLTLQAVGGNTFATWIAGYPGVGAFTGVGDDADGDGSDNGVENFFGTDPSASNSGLVAGAVGVNTFTFTHPQNATPASDLTAVYQWSKDLAIFYASGASDGSSTVTFTTQANTPGPGTTTVTATVTGTATPKLFVNIKVTQP